MASINGEAPAAAGNINPLLLASALVGSWEALDVLFKREDAQEPPMVIPTQEFLALLASARGRIAEPDTRDVELGAYRQPASFAAGELLHGVTPGGDTALHAVAGNGDRNDFLKYAGMICGRERGLLFAKNHNGDTPLHCAARAGNSKMVCLLIGLAGREGHDRKLMLLRMENKRQETALHEAVRNGDGRILGHKDREALFDAQGTPAEERIRAFVEQQEERTTVKLLMGADPELANYPVDGISPLYLAILLEKSTIALILYDRSGGNLSYYGADGQNALHVAVLRDIDTVIMDLLLDWNKSLITQVDRHGSTPLHFASAHEPLRRFPWCRFVRFHPKQALHELFKANPAALYQADKNGLFPIHVAASVGTINVIQFFLHERPDSGGLRDSQGKTFLHVAIENGRWYIVMDVCAKPSLAWILNMQDNDGNTALHLAIQAGSLDMATTLIGNPKVNLNLTNNQGETPHDISIIKLLRGMTPAKNSESRINYVLRCVRAKHGAFRWDKNVENYRRRSKPEDQDKQSERLKDATQSYMVASVLISTMAFSATFAIPGGYRADDRANGGTPTLAGSYIFDAYIMASTLSFICSLLSTTGFMLAGNTMVSLVTRKFYIDRSAFFISGSVTSLCIAFPLGVYMALAPVALRTAIAVCFIIPFLLLARSMGFNSESIFLARPILIRKGLFRGMVLLLRLSGAAMVTALWPFVVIFGWAALARIHLTVEQFDHLIMVSFWPTVVICGQYIFRIMYNVLHFCIKGNC